MSTQNENTGSIKTKEVIVDSRINKVLALRTDSVAMLEALDAISEFYDNNTVDSRRKLRYDLELQNITLAKKFLNEFDKVKQRIDSIDKLSRNLETQCGALAAKVKDADKNMKTFMEKASHLENRKNFYETQSIEIQTFLSRFQLSNKEIELLHHANMDLSDNANYFFEALRRLESAYSDCKRMVEKHCYSVGFELLEVLGQHQDMAYQHLFEWVKSKCVALSETGTSSDLDTNTKLQISIRFLKKVPIYFDQCQDLLVGSRRTQLVQRFITALTQGDPLANGGKGGSVRALDLQAHDAPRYVGGMLAWMHQAIASELEFLEAIFGEGLSNSKDINSNETADGKAVDDPNTEGEHKAGGFSVPELLARCLQGLGSPLRSRITQSLETKSGLEVLYSLTDLLTFYQRTFSRAMPVENAVHSAVKGSLIECKRKFLTTLNNQAESLIQSPVSYPLDLKASHVTRECAIQVKEILRVCSSALSTLTADNTEECHVDAVLGNIIQPLLQSCRMGGQSLQSAEMAIFMLNNVSALQHEILEASQRTKQSYKSSSWLSLLEQESTTWVDVLVKEEVYRTLHRSDVDKLLELVDVVPSGIKACDQVGLSSDRVGTVMRSFYASLFSTVAAQFERLQDPRLREKIRSYTAKQVSDAHEKLHKFISDPVNGYESASILAHSISEVSVLLGCDVTHNS